MKKTLMLAAALCALLPFASCGGKKSDAKAPSGSGAAVEAGGSTKDADKAAEKAAKDAAKVLKGAKDAAGAFEIIAKQLADGQTDAALSAIDAAVALVKNEKATPESQFRYELTKDGSGVRLLGPAGEVTFEGRSLVFPDTIEGMPVKEINESYGSVYTGPTSVVVPEGVEVIAFDEGALNGPLGYKLVYASLPSSLKEICTRIFRDCKNLVRIDIPADSKLTVIPGGFAKNTGIKSFTIPSNVKEIGWQAFEGCDSLTSIEIPGGVTEIGDSAFYACSKLEKVTLPSTLKVVGSYAFKSCSNLTEVIVPEGMGKVKWSTYGNEFEGTHLNLKSQAALKAIGYTGEF